MKLSPHIQQLQPIPEALKKILWDAVKVVNLDDPASLCKEEAFYDACNRYDAKTDFFHEVNNFYSGVLPRSEVTDSLQPFFEHVITTLLPEHTVFRAQIVRNIPGRIVRPHIDPRLYHDLSHRIHAVLETNDRCGHVYFEPDKGFEMDVLYMPAGFIYDFDNITPHSAFNLGDSDRLHVIVDMIPNVELNKYRDLFLKDPNHVLNETSVAYRTYVNAINRKYGGDAGLIAAYETRLQTR